MQVLTPKAVGCSRHLRPFLQVVVSADDRVNAIPLGCNHCIYNARNKTWTKDDQSKAPSAPVG